MNNGDAAGKARDVIEKHALRLNTAREHVAMVDEHVEKLLRNRQRTTWIAIESAQARLLVYLRRAERQLEALSCVKADQLIEQEQTLNATWDELALSTQRLISRVSELDELDDDQT